jgi:hypothetical protein
VTKFVANNSLETLIEIVVSGSIKNESLELAHFPVSRYTLFAQFLSKKLHFPTYPVTIQ